MDPADRPDLMRLHAWAKTAKIGARIVYHVGGSYLDPVLRPAVLVLAARLYAEKKAFLTQRRLGPGHYEYVAERCYPAVLTRIEAAGRRPRFDPATLRTAA